MKPKNRTYCPCCQKLKLSFETEAKAENFMKYNADDIYKETGKKPVRTYYCMACGAWHVTSLEKSFCNVSRMEYNLIEYSRQMQAKREAKKKETLVNELINKFRSKMKVLERLTIGQKINKAECLQRLQSLKKNFEVFKANITGHKRFLEEMTSRIETLARNCTPAKSYINNNYQI